MISMKAMMMMMLMHLNGRENCLLDFSRLVDWYCLCITWEITIVVFMVNKLKMQPTLGGTKQIKSFAFTHYNTVYDAMNRVALKITLKHTSSVNDKIPVNDE